YLSPRPRPPGSQITSHLVDRALGQQGASPAARLALGRLGPEEQERPRTLGIGLKAKGLPAARSPLQLVAFDAVQKIVNADASAEGAFHGKAEEDETHALPSPFGVVAALVEVVGGPVLDAVNGAAAASLDPELLEPKPARPRQLRHHFAVEGHVCRRADAVGPALTLPPPCVQLEKTLQRRRALGDVPNEPVLSSPRLDLPAPPAEILRAPGARQHLFPRVREIDLRADVAGLETHRIRLVAHRPPMQRGKERRLRGELEEVQYVEAARMAEVRDQRFRHRPTFLGRGEHVEVVRSCRALAEESQPQGKRRPFLQKRQEADEPPSPPRGENSRASPPAEVSWPRREPDRGEEGRGSRLCVERLPGLAELFEGQLPEIFLDADHPTSSIASTTASAIRSMVGGSRSWWQGISTIVRRR